MLTNWEEDPNIQIKIYKSNLHWCYIKKNYLYLLIVQFGGAQDIMSLGQAHAVKPREKLSLLLTK